eukprot:TRINITY_DN2830_c1_g1_i1.p1 TRINITY_DN2830_c1_g1~~TRINITY_DN2830_c1_g1_i1.p1  ORF type:complete len:825 (-),score=179.99 TRINITY_DN2830_c1_g1_i1:61-2535(-)
MSHVKVTQLLRRCDADGDGVLDKPEFHRFMEKLYPQGHEQFSEEDIEEMFNSVDTDGSNFITIDEYVCWAFGGKGELCPDPKNQSWEEKDIGDDDSDDEEAQDPDFSDFEVGDMVKVGDDVDKPKFNWGKVRRGDIGRVISISGDRCRVNFPRHSKWLGYAPEMEKVDPADIISEGDRVRVHPDVEKPKYNWGKVKRGDVGTVISVNGKDCKVDFPRQKKWSGLCSEMEKVTEEEEKETDKSEIVVGSKVTVRKGVKPKYNWGKVKRGDVGVILKIWKENECKVKFERQSKWSGWLPDLVLADVEEEEEEEEEQDDEWEKKGFVPGAIVKVKEDVETPKFKWGKARHGMEGRLQSVDGDMAKVEFPQLAKLWKAYLPEMEIVHDEDSDEEAGDSDSDEEPSSAEFVAISGAKRQRSRVGIYKKDDSLEPGSDNGGRPIYKQMSGDQFLYYWEPRGSWRVCDDYSSSTAGIISKDGENTECPTAASTWYQWCDGDFNRTDSLTVSATTLPWDDGHKDSLDKPAFWKRCQYIDEDAVLFADIHPNDISQGGLGDCWLLAAFASMAEFPKSLKLLFKRDDLSKKGCYTLRLFDLNTMKWKTIRMDDKLPCGRNGRTKNAKLVSGVAWAPLLEKACAILYGSYKALEGGWGPTAWASLLGCTKGFSMKRDQGQDKWRRRKMVWNNNDDYDVFWSKWPDGSAGHTWKEPEELFDYMVQWDKQRYLMSASAHLEDDDAHTVEGIVQSHEYSLIRVFSGSGLKLIQLRNPWSHQEWQGAWSDSSSTWEDHPDLAEELKVDTKDDGLFWMGLEDFNRIFDYVCVMERAMPAS